MYANKLHSLLSTTLFVWRLKNWDCLWTERGWELTRYGRNSSLGQECLVPWSVGQSFGVMLSSLLQYIRTGSLPQILPLQDSVTAEPDQHAVIGVLTSGLHQIHPWDKSWITTHPESWSLPYGFPSLCVPPCFECKANKKKRKKLSNIKCRRQRNR